MLVARSSLLVARFTQITLLGGKIQPAEKVPSVEFGVRITPGLIFLFPNPQFAAPNPQSEKFP